MIRLDLNLICKLKKHICFAIINMHFFQAHAERGIHMHLLLLVGPALIVLDWLYFH